MKTKQEQKDEAWKRYMATQAPIWEAYRARIREIDEQDKPLQVEKE